MALSAGVVRLTAVGTDKGSLGEVIVAADAPALALGHEDLEPHLDAALRHAVRACAGVTTTLPVALVHAEGKTHTHTHVNI